VGRCALPPHPPQGSDAGDEDPQVGHVQPRPPVSRAYGPIARASAPSRGRVFALIPATIVAAMFVGEGLLTACGYDVVAVVVAAVGSNLGSYLLGRSVG